MRTGWGVLVCGCDENYQRCGLRYSGDDRSTSRPQIRSYKKLREKHSIEMCSNKNIRLYPLPASLPRSFSHSLSILFLPQPVILSSSVVLWFHPPISLPLRLSLSLKRSPSLTPLSVSPFLSFFLSLSLCLSRYPFLPPALYLPLSPGLHVSPSVPHSLRLFLCPPSYFPRCRPPRPSVSLSRSHCRSLYPSLPPALSPFGSSPVSLTVYAPLWSLFSSLCT